MNGEVHPYFAAMRWVEWLKENFDLPHLDTPRFLEKWTDDDLTMHVHFHEVHNHPAVLEAEQFRRDIREGKRRPEVVDGGKD